MLGQHPTIRLPEETPPQLIVVIDTEEEFDWGAHPDRNATSVTAMAKIDRAQSIFDRYGIAPLYVIDYPVASQPAGFEPLVDIHKEGRCEIGAHLHPWVNPPFDEELSRSNMYPGNLDYEIEKAKIVALTKKIEQVFGFRPTSYKAGRYGVGPNTTRILEELGFDIDLSVCPPVDYRADGGPDFRHAPCEPFRFGSDNQLLELPITGAFVGWARGMAQPLYSLATRSVLQTLKTPGILARLGALDRLMLSPEGFDANDHQRITEALYSYGVRTFTWSFHSTSVVPGCAPYVQTEADLARFLDMFEQFFDFFFGTLNGVAATPTGLKAMLEGRTS